GLLHRSDGTATHGPRATGSCECRSRRLAAIPVLTSPRVRRTPLLVVLLVEPDIGIDARVELGRAPDEQRALLQVVFDVLPETHSVAPVSGTGVNGTSISSGSTSD